jgi:high affinity Mn2+ porin
MFSDVKYAASLGLSLKGTGWNRADDVLGLAGVYSGIGRAAQQYLANGGTGGILDGDGALSYGGEQVLETYYSFQVHAGVSFSLDYQFIDHPAFNTARGPVSVFGARWHMEY